jgi:hypothetical protein
MKNEPVAWIGGEKWQMLSDDDRIEVLNTMPDYMDGFCKTWGWLNFSKATEKKIIEKNRHLITHPAKTLTDKEIIDLWLPFATLGIKGKIAFARAILKRASENG